MRPPNYQDLPVCSVKLWPLTLRTFAGTTPPCRCPSSTASTPTRSSTSPSTTAIRTSEVNKVLVKVLLRPFIPNQTYLSKHSHSIWSFVLCALGHFKAIGPKNMHSMTNWDFSNSVISLSAFSRCTQDINVVPLVT